MPVLVVGGLEGWKQDVGDAFIVRGDGGQAKQKVMK